MDPYKVLGVNENATDAEIKAAYHAVSYTHLTLPTIA